MLDNLLELNQEAVKRALKMIKTVTKRTAKLFNDYTYTFKYKNKPIYKIKDFNANKILQVHIPNQSLPVFTF